MSQADDLRVRRHGGLAKVTENHFAVALGEALPGSEHDVVEGLLEVELTHRSYRCAEAPLGDYLGHGVCDFRVAVQDTVVPHHLRVGGQRTSGHGREEHARLDPEGLRGQEVVFQTLAEDLLNLADLMDVNVELDFTAVQSLVEGENVRLGGAAGDRCQRAVDLVRPGVQGGDVLLDTDAGALVAVKGDARLTPEELPGAADGLSDDRRRGRAGGVLEANRLVGDLRVQNVPENPKVEVRCVCPAESGREPHKGDRHLMPETRVGNSPARIDEVVDIIESVEVSDL